MFDGIDFTTIITKLVKSEINEIVLVGSSTRIPKIRNLLHDFFDGKHLNDCVHPDEAVAYGASVFYAVITGDKNASRVSS